MKVEPRFCDIRAAANATLMFVQSYAAVPVGVAVEEAVPEKVWVDELRVKQVVINGLSNACKLTTEGRIDVRIALTGSGMLRVEVWRCTFVARAAAAVAPYSVQPHSNNLPPPPVLPFCPGARHWARLGRRDRGTAVFSLWARRQEQRSDTRPLHEGHRLGSVPVPAAHTADGGRNPYPGPHRWRVRCHAVVSHTLHTAR